MLASKSVDDKVDGKEKLDLESCGDFWLFLFLLSDGVGGGLAGETMLGDLNKLCLFKSDGNIGDVKEGLFGILFILSLILF